MRSLVRAERGLRRGAREGVAAAGDVAVDRLPDADEEEEEPALLASAGGGRAAADADEDADAGYAEVVPHVVEGERGFERAEAQMERAAARRSSTSRRRAK